MRPMPFLHIYMKNSGITYVTFLFTYLRYPVCLYVTTSGNTNGKKKKISISKDAFHYLIVFGLGLFSAVITPSLSSIPQYISRFL